MAQLAVVSATEEVALAPEIRVLEALNRVLGEVGKIAVEAVQQKTLIRYPAQAIAPFDEKTVFRGPSGKLVVNFGGAWCSPNNEHEFLKWADEILRGATISQPGGIWSRWN